MERVNKLSRPEKSYRKPSIGRNLLGLDRKPAPPSDEQCETALHKGRQEKGKLSVRKLKDQANVVTHWIEEHKAQFSSDIQKTLEDHQKTVHKKFVAYSNKKKWAPWSNQTLLDQKGQEAKKAIDNYLQYAIPHLSKALWEKSASEMIEKLARSLKISANYISEHKEAFEEMGYSFEQFRKIQSGANSSLQGNITELGKINPNREKLLIEDCNAITKLCSDLTDFLKIDRSREGEKDAERKKRIEKRLKELPHKGDRPTLSDLPEEEWWKLFINRPLHKDAQQRSDPGSLYERREPGYRQGMIELFKTVLLPAQRSKQKDMDDDDYRYSCTKWWMHRELPFAFSQQAF